MVPYSAVVPLSGVIAAALLLSATGKLIDRRETAAGLLEYGISVRWSGVVAGLLPLGEIIAVGGLILRLVPVVFILV